MRTIRLQVSLREAHPPATRTLDVPADATLPELHDLLQAAMGWTDSHLHEFVAGERSWAVPHPDDFVEDRLDATAARLRDLPARFVYHYDFGDSWEHDVEQLGRGEEQPGLRGGEGACPPEDCGGPGGYEELREAFADPTHPEHASMREWLGGELPVFDAGYVDRRIRETVGTVPESVRLLLEIVGAGVKLTPGGRLPRVTVRQMQEHRPGWCYGERPASIEEDLIPLLVLHDLLRSTGLLRLAKGVLSPTRAAAAGDGEILRRLRAHFAPEKFFTIVAGMALGSFLAEGPASLEELAGRLHPRLGPGWTYAGRPMEVRDLRMVLADNVRTWVALDLVVDEGRRYAAGPSARTLLSAPAVIADAWSH